MFKHKGAAWVVACTVFAVGCGDGALQVENAGIEEAPEIHLANEVMYLMTPTEVGDMFMNDEALLVPERGFYGAVLMFTMSSADAPLTLEVAMQGHDGLWSEWSAVVPDTREGEYVTASFELGHSARTIKLRNPGELEFMRVEFLNKVSPEGLAGFDDDNHGGESHDDHTIDPGILEQQISRAGRYLPSAEAVQSGRPNVRYDRAPSWSGGRNCSGRMRPGATALGRYLVEHFPGAKFFQGYNCRQVRGSSSMSMHGTGRAVDVFIPLHRGQADNDLGDPVANWLIANSRAIGVQYIVWDRSSWNGSRSGTKHRSYGGAHPHHDHLHIELNTDGSNQRTSFFTSGAINRAPTNVPISNPGSGGRRASCQSGTLGRRVENGECVQTSYENCGGRCKWSRCDDGAWVCTETAACTVQHNNDSCNPPAPRPKNSCQSATLGRAVPHGECVQMSYQKCNGTCRWSICDDGTWRCSGTAACSVQHEHAQCVPPPPAPPRPPATPMEPAQPPPPAPKASCYSRTLGKSVDEGACVQMNYNSCNGAGTCQWAACGSNGAWVCQPESACTAQKYAHTDCSRPAGKSCYSRTLGRSVDAGGHVQMSYNSCGGTCKWAECVDGDWMCRGNDSGGAASYPHAACRN